MNEAAPPGIVRDANPPRTITASGVAAAVLGNALEFFDFSSYAYFAVMIGRAFFPAHTPFASLLLSVAAFGVGFVTRPLGGIVIGAYADRAGRKNAMLLTIALMAVGMLVIAATPPYAVIGPAAPVLLVLARLVQGFALGGEVGPATAYLLEAAPSARRGLYASWQFASQGMSTLASGLLGVLLSQMLSPSAMQAWGWRVPFLLGLAIVPVGLIIRNRLPETAERAAHVTTRSVLAELTGRHLRILVLAIFVVMSTTIATYVGNYMTTYALSTLHMATGVAFAATVAVGICRILASLAGGWLADHLGRRPVMIGSQILLAALVYPAFLLLNQARTLGALVLASAVLATLTALSGAVGLALIPESLPKAVRSAGLAIAYAVAVTVFGGSTQVVVTWLIAVTGNPLSPAWYLVVSSLIGVGAIAMLRETRDAEVTR